MPFKPNLDAMKHGLGTKRGPVAVPKSKPAKPATSKGKTDIGKAEVNKLMKEVSKNEEISIQKIDNGYLTVSSSYNEKKQKWQTTKVYTEKHPVTGK